MTTYRGQAESPTIKGMGEPEPAQPPSPPSQRERTPHGDALAFGFVSVAFLALAAVLGHALGFVPLWWCLGVAGFTVVSSAVARISAGPTAIAGWLVTAFCFAGGWLAWSRLENLKHPVPWLVLGGGSVLLAVSWPLVVVGVNRREAAARRRAADREREAKENWWPMLLGKLGHKDVKFLSWEQTRNGYVMRLQLPSSGKVTWKTLVRDTDKLEAAAAVRHGSLRFERGDLANEVLLYVSTVDVLAQTVPYVDDGKPLSIRNPIPVGLYEDGSVCSLTLREVCALIIGLRGAGKSNLLNVLIAQLVRCVDVLLFVIDTKHRLVTPWVRPYLSDPAAGEAIEWAVTDRAGTEAMLNALLEAIRQRSASGSGGEKIEPTPSEPAVLTIVDEVASIFGEGRGPRYSAEGTTNTTLAGIGAEAIQLGRSEAIDFVLATQRGTVTMVGSGDLKSQCAVRIGMRVVSEADARLVFPDDQNAAQLLAALKHPGSGLLMEDREGRTAPVKFFRIEPAQIPEIARRYGPLKPAPDPVLERALGEAYQARWDAFKAVRQTAAIATADMGTNREFERIVSGLGDVAETDVSAARQRMRDFMGRSGDRGVTVGMVASLLDSENMGVSDRTVRNWIAADIELGIVERAKHGMYRLRRPAGA
ncbi:MAG: hypothetical protein J2P30_00035 [Actinobacteria bacterium]|nr:hypothetical protein [Actinomycetota bacterium]